MDNGSIVHVDYDLYNASNDKLIETTREEVAKEHDVHDENREYSPMITTVGGGRLIPGFESHLAEPRLERITSSISSQPRPMGIGTRTRLRLSHRTFS